MTFAITKNVVRYWHKKAVDARKSPWLGISYSAGGSFEREGGNIRTSGKGPFDP